MTNTIVQVQVFFKASNKECEGLGHDGSAQGHM